MRQAMIVVLVLLMASTGLALQPVAVRSPWSNQNWLVYIPADNVGQNWTRYNFGVPNSSYPSYFCLKGILYGPVYVGKFYFEGRAKYTENGTWYEQTANGMRYRDTNDSGGDISIDIGTSYKHNVIQLLSYDAADGGTIDVNWSDGYTADLDLLNINQRSSGKTGLVIYTIATNSSYQNSGATRKVRFTVNAGKARIFGVRSFRSTVYGDPNTILSTDGLALGHDMITDSSNVTANGMSDTNSAIDSAVVCIGQDATTSYEYSISWAVDGGTLRWTGGAAHFGGTQASYTYHSGEYAAGPTILVDGRPAYNVWDDTNNPRGTVRTAYDNINFYSTGFADFDMDATEDANEPNMTWTTIINNRNLTNIITALFKVDSDVSSTGFYISMTMLPTTEANNITFSVPPSATSYPCSADQTISGSEVLMRYPKVIPNVKMSAIGPVSQVYFLKSASKMYLRTNINISSVFPGGTDPTAGTNWTWGGQYEIRAYTPVCSTLKGVITK